MQASEASISLACISLKMDECPKPVQPSRKTSRGEKRFTCKKCFKTYNRSYNLQRHYNYECGVEPKFKCPECPYLARYRNYLKTHYYAKHSQKLDASDTAPSSTN
ncbi:hypothetical protein O3M35_011159 [Rhynocoris fuscipes]|uniref:C2H2-type domain-containing protein n=1 Tax=Rhynocoris fuscipes TaxID=488301 RepID=A0AAW1CVL7_9HEMI